MDNNLSKSENKMKSLENKGEKKNVLVLVADGSEEMEVVIFVDLLRRAGINVDIVSIKENDNIINCSRNVKLVADKNINDLNDYSSYDLVYIPGGSVGVENLKNNPKVKEIINYFYNLNKYVSAICAGPLVLKESIDIKNIKITSYPTLKEQYDNYIDELVVVDNNVITSQGPATTFLLAFKIIEILRSKNIKDTVYNAVLFDKLLDKIKINV
ncbi:MAG: DJ-1/PfpI family protein [bacterium]|nr:DJ-1/PfpI family protein [bacterium]